MLVLSWYHRDSVKGAWHRRWDLFGALPGWQGVEVELQALVRAVCCVLSPEDGCSLRNSRTLKKMAVKVGQYGQQHDSGIGILMTLDLCIPLCGPQ